VSLIDQNISLVADNFFLAEQSKGKLATYYVNYLYSYSVWSPLISVFLAKNFSSSSVLGG
jgi:hypothetical protein